jgi:hypothetical protein
VTMHKKDSTNPRSFVAKADSGWNEEKICVANVSSYQEELADVHYSAMYGFVGGHLDNIDIDFPHTGFETVREYLVTRYGPTLDEYNNDSNGREILWGECGNDPSVIQLALKAVTKKGDRSSENSHLTIMSKQKERQQSKTINDELRRKGQLPGCWNTETNEVFSVVQTSSGVWGCVAPLVYKAATQ